MSATIGRDYVIDLVVGNRRPYTVHFNFVVIANDATLSRPTIHQIAARALAIISFECRVEALMPFIMALPVVPFLRCCAYSKNHGHRAAKGDENAPVHSVRHRQALAMKVYMPCTTPYGFGETRVATLALLTFTALSG